MKRCKKFIFIEICASLFLFWNSVCAQEIKRDPKIALAKLNSDNIEDRISVVSDMMDNGIPPEYNTPAIKDKVFELLTLTAATTGQFWESEFSREELLYDNLRDVVGDFRDERAIPLLIKNWDSETVTVSLAKIGLPAVESVLARRNDPKPSVRETICFYAGVLFATKNPTLVANGVVVKNMYASIFTPTGETKEKIHAALLEAVEDKQPSVRHVCIEALQRFGDPRDAEALAKAIAKTPSVTRHHRLTQIGTPPKQAGN